MARDKHSSFLVYSVSDDEKKVLENGFNVLFIANSGKSKLVCLPLASFQGRLIIDTRLVPTQLEHSTVTHSRGRLLTSPINVGILCFESEVSNFLFSNFSFRG
jgi:hypothetical protein